MSEAALHPLPVIDVREAAAGQIALTVGAAGTPVARGHEHPGQYALLKLGEDVPRPFAMATPPGNDRIEFLLKLPEESAAWVLSRTRDDKIPVSKPRGPGFPVERAVNKAVWLIGTGSGVAPLRAVVEVVLKSRQRFRDVHLLYGVRHPNQIAYAAHFGTWAGQGVQVVPVVSRPPSSSDGGTWDGPVGRVQAHLPPTFEHPQDAVFFLCGLPEMDREVTATLLDRGIAPEQVFRNY